MITKITSYTAMAPHVESVNSACSQILNLNMQAHVYVKPYCTYLAIYLCNPISCSYIAHYLIYIIWYKLATSSM